MLNTDPSGGDTFGKIKFSIPFPQVICLTDQVTDITINKQWSFGHGQARVNTRVINEYQTSLRGHFDNHRATIIPQFLLIVEVLMQQ